MKIKSTLRLACPISGKLTAPIPYEHANGVAEVVEPEEDILLPVGWGRLQLDVVAENPEVSEHAEARRVFITQEVKNAEAMLESDEVPAEVKTQVKTALENGRIAHELGERFDAEHEAPEDGVVYLRFAYDVLSSEAVGQVVTALQGLGFTFERA